MKLLVVILVQLFVGELVAQQNDGPRLKLARLSDRQTKVDPTGRMKAYRCVLENSPGASIAYFRWQLNDRPAYGWKSKGYKILYDLLLLDAKTFLSDVALGVVDDQVKIKISCAVYFSIGGASDARSAALTEKLAGHLPSMARITSNPPCVYAQQPVVYLICPIPEDGTFVRWDFIASDSGRSVQSITHRTPKRRIDPVSGRLQLTDVTKRDEGQYKCVFATSPAIASGSMRHSTSTLSFSLHVTGVPSPPQHVSITEWLNVVWWPPRLPGSSIVTSYRVHVTYVLQSENHTWSTTYRNASCSPCAVTITPLKNKTGESLIVTAWVTARNRQGRSERSNTGRLKSYIGSFLRKGSNWVTATATSRLLSIMYWLPVRHETLSIGNLTIQINMTAENVRGRRRRQYSRVIPYSDLGFEQFHLQTPKGHRHDVRIMLLQYGKPTGIQVTADWLGRRSSVFVIRLTWEGSPCATAEQEERFSRHVQSLGYVLTHEANISDLLNPSYLQAFTKRTDCTQGRCVLREAALPVLITSHRPISSEKVKSIIKLRFTMYFKDNPELPCENRLVHLSVFEGKSHLSGASLFEATPATVK